MFKDQEAAVPVREVPRDTLAVNVSLPSWESHHDGLGGYRPADPARRGSMEMACPQCSKPLIRDGSDEIVRNSTFGCPAPCGARVAGLGIQILPRAE